MPALRLNPIIDIDGNHYVMAAQFASAVRVRDLGRFVVSLNSEARAIRTALDMLLVGF